MAFFDEKKGAVSVEVVEAQLDADEPRTNLTVHPHSFFEGGHARVRDEEGNFILRVDGASVQEKRALRRSFHSRVFDMSTPYGASELTVYPPWCNGRLRFDEHFPRRYFGAKADTTLDVRPMSGDSRRTRILRAGEEIGIITQPRFGLGAWEVSVLPGMDEPMIVALTTILMQQNVTAAEPTSEESGRSTDSVEMVLEAMALLAASARTNNIDL